VIVNFKINAAELLQMPVGYQRELFQQMLRRARLEVLRNDPPVPLALLDDAIADSDAQLRRLMFYVADARPIKH